MHSTFQNQSGKELKVGGEAMNTALAGNPGDVRLTAPTLSVYHRRA
jgi:hypothetical protein